MIALYSQWPILWFLYTFLYTDVVVGGRMTT